MRTSQILALQYFAFVGRRMPSESKKEGWSSECFWPLFSPKVLHGSAARWGGWPAPGRVGSILTLCFFFPWKIQPPSNISGAFLRNQKHCPPHSVLQMGWHLPTFFEQRHRALPGGQRLVWLLVCCAHLFLPPVPCSLSEPHWGSQLKDGSDGQSVLLSFAEEVIQSLSGGDLEPSNNLTT